MRVAVWLWVCAAITTTGSSQTSAQVHLAGKRPGYSAQSGKGDRARQESSERQRERRSNQNSYMTCIDCKAGNYQASSCTESGGRAQCKPCGKGTYTNHPNAAKECIKCSLCQPDQETIKNCSSTNDIVCGCPDGTYRKCQYQQNCMDFHCVSCTICLHRNTTSVCSDTTDRRCGQCLPGYQENNDHECELVTLGIITPWTETSVIPDPTPSQTVLVCVPVVLLLLLLVFVVGFLMICGQRQRVVQEPSTIPVMEEGDPQNIEKPMFVEILTPNPKPELLNNNNIYDNHSPAQEQDSKAGLRPGLVEGRALYEIINVVPVRRWKEFVRLLELKDSDIERVQMDVLLFRDQQYEMLRCWSQQANASLALIYTTLESMGLAGCSQQLQQQLQHQPSLLP